MVQTLREVIAGQLERSLQLKKEYEEALVKLPPGCLAVREIRGHKYAYVVRRAGKKIRYMYQGKFSEREKKRYERIKAARAKYRSLLSKLKRRIPFLKSMLRKAQAV